MIFMLIILIRDVIISLENQAYSHLLPYLHLEDFVIEMFTIRVNKEQKEKREKKKCSLSELYCN